MEWKHSMGFFLIAILQADVFHSILNLGEKKGEADILTRLQKKLDISLQKAQEYLAMFGKQTV